MKRLRLIASIALAAVSLSTCAYVLYDQVLPIYQEWASRKTVEERVEETRGAFESRLLPSLKSAGIESQPTEVVLLFLKDQKKLHLYAKDADSPLALIKTYDVLAASGKPGPKLKEGDRQVPEGIYRIEFLNPNSQYNLSLRLNYPNDFDRKQAQADGRTDLGGDIMIHGSRVSVGCLAIGDDAIAELFHLAATTNFRQWKVILAPTDLRSSDAPLNVIEKHPWMSGMYEQIKGEMVRLPRVQP